jgi:lipopolysaccharide export system permease protein
MALLLATALTVGLLSANRELIGMRACGVSVARALMPILLIASLVAPGYFLLNEVVVPRTNALAEQVKEREIKERAPQPGPLRMMIWYRAGTQVYQATQLDPQLGEAQELSIYDLGANGLPLSRTDARAAKYVGKGVWKLIDPVRVEISDHGLRETPVDPHAQLGEAPNEMLDTKQLGARELLREIRDAEANGYDATIYRVDLHVKLAAPFACVLLPAVALFFAIGGPPFPSPATMILTSSVLGVSYILLTGVCASLGYGGFFPPSLAGWAPSASLAALSGVLARR